MDKTDMSLTAENVAANQTWNSGSRSARKPGSRSIRRRPKLSAENF